MMKFSFTRIALSSGVALLPVLQGIAYADFPDVTFELRPHCESSEHAAASNTFGGSVPEIDGTMTLAENSAPICPSYDVRDPLSKQTNVLKQGDTLDMDLVLHNPSAYEIKRFRVWIGYDSNVLEGKDLTISSDFPIETPGEADFSMADNYMKVTGSTDKTMNEKSIVIARITMTVKATPNLDSILSYYDASGSKDSHTAAFIIDGGEEENVASTVQGALAVRFEQAGASSVQAAAPSTAVSIGSSSQVSVAASAASSVSSAIASSASVTVASSTTSSSSIAGIFTALQIQALRVTTEGSSVFLAWNPLPSNELSGYNLYYGTISGRYLQRRSVNGNAQTLTIRALPVGQTYYFAVRAVNASGQESDFSQEVAVTVGNPATSTSPLSGSLIEDGPQGNAPETGGTIAGESGPETWMFALAVLSALMGTAFALRRQWTATTTLSQ